MIGLNNHKLLRIFPTEFHRLPIGGSGESLSQLKTELDSRNLTANRMNGLFRVADGSSGLTTNTVPAELDARNVDTTHLNRLDENVSAAKQKQITTANGTYTLTSGTSKVTMLELAANNELVEIAIDCNALTTTTTIGVEEKVDGTNYRIMDTISYPADFDGSGVLVVLDGKGRDQKITLTSAGEGADRSVPHSRVEELRAT